MVVESTPAGAADSHASQQPQQPPPPERLPPPTPERVNIHVGMPSSTHPSQGSYLAGGNHGWEDEQEDGDGSQQSTNLPRTEYPGMPPSFEALKSQISGNHRSRSDSAGSATRPLPPTPTPSLVSMPSDLLPQPMSDPRMRPSYAAAMGKDKGRSYRRCLHDHLGEFASLTKMPDEQDPTNVMPLLRIVDYCSYFRNLCMPKGQTSVLQTARSFLYKPIAGLVWFLGLIMWQVVFGLFISTIALVFVDHNNKVTWDSAENGYAREYQLSHRNFGAILGFVIGFRVNIAYQSYYEGRRVVATLLTSVREIVLEAYTSLPKGTAGPRFADTGEVVPGGPAMVNEEVLAEEMRYMRMTACEIRRLCMLLMAFIRQDVREKHFGFLKGTEMEHLPFTSKNFYLDPVRPRLWDLLTEDELLHYAAIPPRARPGVVIGELKVHVESMCLRLEKGESVFVRIVTPQLQNILGCHEAMIRIRDTPVPYPFLYVLNISAFVFVYSTPFFYHMDEVGTYFCVFILIIIYYGLLSISCEIENPFRYAHGGFSLPLETYCHRAHDDCLNYAKALGGDTQSFIPSYLERSEK